MIKLLICKILKIHWYKSEMNFSLSCEGVDEFHRCRLCGDTKIKYMWDK